MEVPEPECQWRWRTLMFRSVRECTKQKFASGSAATDPDNEWALFSHLEFLGEHVKPRIIPPSQAVSISESEEISVLQPEEFFTLQQEERSTPLPAPSNDGSIEYILGDSTTELVDSMKGAFTKRLQINNNKNENFLELVDEKLNELTQNESFIKKKTSNLRPE